MEEMDINGKKIKHQGEPLTAFVHDKFGWAGLSNLLSSDESSGMKIQLKDLADCFNWLKRWLANNLSDFGYILDYKKKTIYYDDEKSLEHLNDQGIKGFFTNFIKKNFRE